MSYQNQREVTDLLHAIKRGAIAAPLLHIRAHPLPEPLQSEAVAFGAGIDSESLEQGE